MISMYKHSWAALGIWHRIWCNEVVRSASSQSIHISDIGTKKMTRTAVDKEFKPRRAPYVYLYIQRKF